MHEAAELDELSDAGAPFLHSVVCVGLVLRKHFRAGTHHGFEGLRSG